jgi:hypothetical protein
MSLGNVDEKYIQKTSVSVHPNPAKQEATLDLTVEHGGRAYISLLDILGNEISVLSRSILEVGEHHFPFSMKSLAPGSYYVRIKTLNDVITQKVIRVE